VIFVPCNSTNYRKGRTDSIKYIVIHYTANNGDTAAGNASYYANNANLSASAHYFIDEHQDVYQSVKDSDTAWHCGASSYKHKYCRNSNSIGIELCSRNPNGKVSAEDKGWYFKEETINNAVKLTKKLMAIYGVPAENVVRHYDVTGKRCPAPFVNDENAWQKFKERISSEGDEDDMKQIEELTKRVEALESKVNEFVYAWVDDNMPEWAKPTIQKLMKKGYLKGDEEGKLNLKYDTLRILVILDRSGAFGE
jgi:N-acetylmuramoyl-L-alanine amidase